MPLTGKQRQHLRALAHHLRAQWSRSVFTTGRRRPFSRADRRSARCARAHQGETRRGVPHATRRRSRHPRAGDRAEIVPEIIRPHHRRIPEAAQEGEGRIAHENRRDAAPTRQAELERSPSGRAGKEGPSGGGSGGVVARRRRALPGARSGPRCGEGRASNGRRKSFAHAGEGNLVWIDLEMTGSRPAPRRHSSGRQVILTTEKAAPRRSRGMRVRRVAARRPELQKMTPFVRDMHQKNGLIDRVRASKLELASAEAAPRADRRMVFVPRYACAATASDRTSASSISGCRGFPAI